MLVFAIESSCDETSVCIINENKEILSHIVYTQENHKKFGGVIPELASRAHLQILQEITRKSLSESKISINDIDIFCATCGPGLIGGLLVGSTFAKSLAINSKKPFMPINHLEGHLLSPTFNNNVQFPFITFLLTGGHTQIYLIKDINNYELLGESVDDAIGEAFDKISKLLGMSYPGGPEIEKMALEGDCDKFLLPEPMKNKKDLNFSFSGIKTAINLIIKQNKEINKDFISDISASFQKTILNILDRKLKAVFGLMLERKINITQVALVGGVAKNKYIRKHVSNLLSKYNCSILLPPEFMLSDNAAMIGWSCIQKKYNNFNSDIYFQPDPRLKVTNNSL